ncbi:MAG: hypothetical protein R3C53_11665 [Pirellulaceae bacterium]
MQRQPLHVTFVTAVHFAADHDFAVDLTIDLPPSMIVDRLSQLVNDS